MDIAGSALARVDPKGVVMVGKGWRGAIAGLVFSGTAIAWALPADTDHQRGLEAFQRGDVAGAMKLLRPPAAAGHAPSQALLGELLERADFSDEAARLYTAASAQGHAGAQAALAGLRLEGRGIAKDEKQALALFSKAADQGHAGAIQVLADAQLKGLMGLGSTRADNARAATDLRRAAELGHAGAAEALARAWREGQYGLRPDPTQSAHWQARAVALRPAVATAKPSARP